VLVRFWKIARQRGYITAADFVRERFGCRTLEVCIALTSIVAAVPYIGLQLVGMKSVFMQLGGTFAWHDGLIALSIAFVVLAAYTYTSGLRAPALIAFVKDTLIYVTVIAAAIVIPAKLGGWEHIFAVTATVLAARPKPGSLYLAPSQYFAYATMALGSAMSLFIYPHSITSVLAAKSAGVIRRNAALLPIYSILLAILALLGYCAVAAGVVSKDSTAIVPLLFARMFPDWFAGVAFAAIVIGALVPAAIMAIGAANLFASNVFAEFSHDRARGSAQQVKLLTLAICACGLAIIFFVPVPYAIDFQLLGGALLLQIFPALVFGLWTRWFVPKALILGWGCGIVLSCAMMVASGFTANYTLHVFGASISGFIAIYAFVVNLAVASLTTLALRRGTADPGTDGTTPGDYA